MGANECFDGAKLYPNLTGLVIISDGLSVVTSEETAALLMPKLLVYGDEDTDVTNTMDEIYQNVPEPKRLAILPVKAHGTDL